MLRGGRHTVQGACLSRDEGGWVNRSMKDSGPKAAVHRSRHVWPLRALLAVIQQRDSRANSGRCPAIRSSGLAIDPVGHGRAEGLQLMGEAGSLRAT
jgi:hypothetical protein